MEKENQVKAIIEKHIEAMFSDLGSGKYNVTIGWIGENATAIATDAVFNLISYGMDVEAYMQKEGMLI